MKKMFTTLVVFCVAQFALFALPVCGCSQENATDMTGGACSIKELKNLEKMKNQQGQIGSEPKVEVDLRPVRYNAEMKATEDKGCLFGQCLYKTILGE